MIKIGKHISCFSTYSCQPKTKIVLKSILDARIAKEGNNCDLNDIDTSLITYMDGLFYDSPFNGDISKWNVSKVKYMPYMFYKSEFTGDISKWDVSKVTDMSCMFKDAVFVGDISNWNINKDCDTGGMFYGCPIKEEHKPKSLQR